jgi:hypothetical protein
MSGGVDVQIVENWTDISGVVRERRAAGREGFEMVEISVERAQPVQGYANLLGETKGTYLEVLVPEALVARHGIDAGDAITCRVRLGTRRQVFVHQEHISLRRPRYDRSKRDEA